MGMCFFYLSFCFILCIFLDIYFFLVGSKSTFGFGHFGWCGGMIASRAMK